MAVIIVTGGAGFIGSCLIGKLNRLGRQDILAVDSLGCAEKWRNLARLAFDDYVDKGSLFDLLPKLKDVEAIIHMGACSSTTEPDVAYLMENNYRYTLHLARFALAHDIRFIYASSAATYGDGQRGYGDDESALHLLRPLNAYGYSKQVFDLKAHREGWLDRMVGLKFFNVYGPNEYHKGDMTSVVYKAFHQIKNDGRVKLFKSHREGIDHGAQQRDFVYVKDVVELTAFLLENPAANGLFNVGTGQARTFKDLVSATFAAMDRPVAIDYIDMPESIRDRYQYFTQAGMAKLRGVFRQPMRGLEEGIQDYVQTYLMKDEFYGGCPDPE